jgi:hypothetical protein
VVAEVLRLTLKEKGVMGRTIKYGVFMFMAIGGFFLAVNGIGYGYITELRVVNILFIILFSNLLARKYWIEEDGIEYVGNFLSILSANFVNVLLCMIGFIVYISMYDPEYLNTVSNGLLWSSESSLAQVLIALFFEGMAGSAVVSFAIMQYWKDRKRQHRTVF